MSWESQGRGSFREATQPSYQPKHKPKTDWLPLKAEARRLLPGEPIAFTVGAILVLRSSGQPVTAASVRARLLEQGRTKAQLGSEAA